MRKEMKSLVKAELRNLALTTRHRLSLTQREMAELLSMSEHSYSEIEIGKTSCGTLTTLLLIQMQDDPREFLKRIEDRIGSLYETTAKTG